MTHPSGRVPLRNTFSFDTTRFRADLPSPDMSEEIFLLVGGDDRLEVCSTLIWDGPDRREDVAGWVERCQVESYEDWGFHWVIRDRDGALTGMKGKPIGAVSTRPLGPQGRADVGYWVGKPYWGRGVMSEVLPALLEFGFETMGFVKMEAEVFTTNARGRRLVEKAGMIEEGVTRRGHLKRGVWVDVAHYGMLVEEWEGGER